MKVLTGEQMAELDRQAIEGLGLPVLVLMENAGRSVVLALKKYLAKLEGARVVVAAGRGNNGGDGLVAARHLLNLGAKVKTFIVGAGDPSGLTEAAGAQARFITESGLGRVEFLPDGASLAELEGALAWAEVIIDALLGVGVRGPLREPYARAVELINAARAADPAKMIVAVDLPSGLEADTGHVPGPCVRADVTVTMALPKLGLLLYPGRDYVGELELAEVGYPRSLIERYESKLELIDKEWVAGKLPPRRAYSHKGTYGRVLVIAGSRGYTGAAALTALAALRAGAGLVTLGIPASLNPILEAKLTEVITRPLPEVDGALAEAALPEIQELIGRQDVLAVGPGLGRHPETARLVKALLRGAKLPTVLDADGINVLADEPEVLKEAQAPLVLTPHPGELSRLIELEIEEIEADRVGVARRIAAEFGVILVLKGVPTVIARPDGFVWINSTGNSGLASGGSGDVLTGMIAGLLAQGLPPEEAAPCGVYLHGLIADRLKPRMGERAQIAGDLIAGMHEVLREFE